MKIIEVDRKTSVLHKAQFGCLRHTYTLNVSRGCEFMCVYCYARGYPNAPPPGEIFLYKNLPEKLSAELGNPRIRSKVSWVSFNTATDCFQTHPAVQDITFEAMKMLLEKTVGFSFLTKGRIPNRFIKLFSGHPDQIHPTLCLVSVRSRYQELFEPQAASPSERLGNIDRLQAAGLKVHVRVDPIIPFITDDQESISELCSALATRGIRKLTLSYLHIRPAILDQLSQELPRTQFVLLKSCFGNRPWKGSANFIQSRLAAPGIRKGGYDRFKAIAKDFGITPLICACKNPDMEGQICSTPSNRDYTEKAPKQLSLFQC
jgi:DNA repair photolyase